MQVPGHRFVARHGLQRFHIPAMPEGHAVDGGQAAAEKFLPGGVDLCRQAPLRLRPASPDLPPGDLLLTGSVIRDPYRIRLPREHPEKR